jgi:hypothetical protein
MKPTVGITFFLREKESIWNNGGAQNCWFLVELLRAAGHRVIAVNGGESDKPDPALCLPGVEFVPIAEAIDQVDVLIEGAAQVSREHVERVRSRGGRAIKFCFGNAYVIDAERIIHGKKPGAIVNGARFDEIWTNPQHVATCGSYWETIYRCPVRVLPHVWLPTFVDRAISEFPSGTRWGYQPGRRGKRVGIFEPNINVVKTAVIPLLACELLYREHPELLREVYVTNALAWKGHLTAEKLCGSLDVVRNGSASFEGRFNTPWFLARYCDVVVSHQWENGLNYAYYDALHGGYPLIHNSEFLPAGVGYRYEGFSAHDAAQVLQRVIRTHDAGREEYGARATAFLQTVNALSSENVAEYARTLEATRPRLAA